MQWLRLPTPLEADQLPSSESKDISALFLLQQNCFCPMLCIHSNPDGAPPLVGCWAKPHSRADQYSSHTGKVPQKINTVISWAPSPGNRVGCWSASEGRFSAGLSHLVNWWSVPMPFPAVVRLFPKHCLYPPVIWEFWGRIHPNRGCYNYQINQAATMTETLNCRSFLCKL